MTSHEFFNLELGRFGENVILMKNVLLGIIVMAITWILILFLRKMILQPRFIIDKVDAKRRNSVFLIIKFLGWTISVFIAIKVMGFEITALLFGSTALLIGLGLGLQNIFKDFVSGLFLLFEGSLKIGDIVEFDGIVGKVLEINLRSSEILTRDDVTIIIPNSKFIVEKVTNWSHGSDDVRFTVNVNVAYGSDVERVFYCLEQTMEENSYISKTPKNYVRFKNFGESALEFELIFWSKHGFIIDNVKSDLRRIVYKKLANEGLNIPFPQRDIYIKEMASTFKDKSGDKV